MLSYRRLGTGYPIILVHGFLGASSGWLPTIAVLSRQFDVVAVDLPGFGGARDQPALKTIADAADAVLATADAIGLEHFHLVGHSYGGYVAQEMALRCSGQMSRLVLYGTALSGALKYRFEPAERSIARIVEEGLPAAADRIVASWFRRGSADPWYPLCREIAKAVSPENAVAVINAITAWSAEGRIERLTMPVLVIGGDCDRSISPLDLVTLWQNVPKALLAIVPNAAHNLHLERPDIFIRLLLDFLC